MPMMQFIKAAIVLFHPFYCSTTLGVCSMRSASNNVVPQVAPHCLTNAYRSKRRRWGANKPGANQPGGKQARGRTSQGAKEPGANQPGGELARGEQARGERARGRTSQGRISQKANEPGGRKSHGAKENGGEPAKGRKSQIPNRSHCGPQLSGPDQGVKKYLVLISIMLWLILLATA